MGDGYMSIKEMELETKLAHGCHTPDSETRSLTSPIYQTATYGAVLSLIHIFNEHLAALLLVVPIQLMSCTIAGFKGINLGIKIFKDFDAVLKSKI